MKKREKLPDGNRKMQEKKNRERKPEKVKSIKRTFFLYLPLCVVIAYAGAYGIGLGTNELQDWYTKKYSDIDYEELVKEAYERREQLHGDTAAIEAGSPQEESGNTETYYRYEFVRTVYGIEYYDVEIPGRFFSDSMWRRVGYNMIGLAQAILMPAWVLFCVGVTGVVFYKRELERPIRVLRNASEKISENCLDFQVERVKQNELGQLCQSFEDMRQALYENNQKLWRTLEERKRLNAAFSHDIRTPLAVLKGYQEMMETYVPEGRLSEERLMEMIETMGKQITRLENYTQKMTQVQKLEDIVPEPENVKVEELVTQCQEAGNLLAGELMLELRTEELCRNIQEMPKKGMDQDVWDDQECGMTEEWSIDRELFLEVFENLVSNAVRFAKEKIMVTLCRKGTADVGDSGEEAAGRYLCLVVEDDGPGFSEEALERGMEPFFGSEKDGRVHFGLGLHICKVICEKHGGKLWLENGASGGRVSACFGDLDKRKADSLEK